MKNKAKWNWEAGFPASVLQLGKQDAENGRIHSIKIYEKEGVVEAHTAGGFLCQARIPLSYDECLNYEPWYSGQRMSYASWDWHYERDKRHYCNCSSGIKGTLCRHVAAMMYAWQKEGGQTEFEETEEERAFRLKMQEEQRERERQEKIRQEKIADIFPALRFLEEQAGKAPALSFFQPDLVFRDVMTNRYETELALKSLEKEPLPEITMNTSYNREGEQQLEISGCFRSFDVSLTLENHTLTKVECNCGRSHSLRRNYWGSKEKDAFLCEHALPIAVSAWNRIIREKPGDATDKKADQLFTVLTARQAPEEIVVEEPEKKTADVVLTPKIIVDKKSNTLQLSFTIGRRGERAFAVRSLAKLLSAIDNSEEYSLSKKTSIQFSSETFTEDCEKWIRLLQARAYHIDSINRRLERTFYYTPTLSVGNTIPLEGSDLDDIYDLAEGSRISYQYGGRTEECSIFVCQGKPQAEITIKPVRDQSKKLIGIDLSGSMPRLLSGTQYQYIVDDHQFGRVTEDDMQILLPFRSISNADGLFSCRIGLKKFPEFYFRILPALRESDQILLHDLAGDPGPELLPPEPEFIFYMDLEEDRVTCRPTVGYGEEHFPVGFSVFKTGILRDSDQENRVSLAVGEFFDQKDSSRMIYTAPADEETLFRILTEGVRILSQYGEVKGSDAFGSVHTKPAPQPRFSVEIEGGLLELSIQTKDLSSEELLELLSSFRLKKRWHRLRSGDFVDLRKADSLKELDEMAGSMEVSLDDMIRGDVKLPKFRALYVDKLLEGHDEIATARDKHFKSLLRSFRTIKDSDFEVSESLSDVVRPYQLYGFRWLSTLSQAGFGGILADEMGLGKTLQMLAFFQARKDDGEKKPSLVICPASLVYNWKEECERFTKGLKTGLLAGTLPQRKKLLKELGGENGADLYVTSYDLLKRDITLYENTAFSTIVLDEAQYIKNQNTAVAKAVKILKSDHRFALTGTPIENRLSELWSIFDFLMPGFLYNASEFRDRFEGPIMKKKDPDAADRLSRMTSPFILRRKKTDVLKDLPEKLEEIQAQAMEDDQRKLYDAQVVHMREMLGSFSGTGEDKMRILAEITKLRQICCDPSLLFENYRGSSAKRSACLELIQRAIDGGHRMLVFSQFTSMLALLSTDLKKEKIGFYTLTGSTPKQERIRLVNEFNNGNVPVFLISLKAGGTGLNLTGADVVIHYDPWWNLAVQNQATDRAHRIGQTRQVTVIKLIAAESIEEKIIRLQEAKRDLAETIISGEGTSLMSMSREELMELLE